MIDKRANRFDSMVMVEKKNMMYGSALTFVNSAIRRAHHHIKKLKPSVKCLTRQICKGSKVSLFL